MLENAAPPFIENLFPHEKFPPCKDSPNVPPPPSTLPPYPKNSPENVCRFPSNHYYMKTQVKVCNL